MEQANGRKKYLPEKRVEIMKQHRLKLINRILVSFLFLTFLVPFTAFGHCALHPGELATCIGKGKTKERALNNLDYVIARYVDNFCYSSNDCSYSLHCIVKDYETTEVKCKYSASKKRWICRTKVKNLECTCVAD